MKLKKSTKIWIIIGSIVVALGLTFVIMLFSSQKEKQLHTTGDPIKDSKAVMELLVKTPEKVKEYLGFVVTEYTDPAKTESFKQALETAVQETTLTVSGDPIKDAAVFVSVAFLEVNNIEVCQLKAMEFLEMAAQDSAYVTNSEKRDSFKAQLDTLLNNEGMSLSDLGIEF